MFLEVNGVNLFYEKMGEGEPIILIHGNSENHSVFDKLMDSLPAKYSVYAVDSRDHGQSSKVKDLYYNDMAEDIAGFIRALNLHKPAVLGFSDGGIVGLMLSFTYPDLLSQLIICGANTRPNGMKRKPLFLMKLGYLFSRNNKLKLMLTQPNITEHDLRKITVPTLVLAGENDLIIDSHTRELAGNIKNSRLRILKSETHSSYITEPQKLINIIIPFLAGDENN